MQVHVCDLILWKKVKSSFCSFVEMWNLFLLKKKINRSILIICKSSKTCRQYILEVIRGFHTVCTVIHVACTGPVIGASLYAFVEFGQKRTVPISCVFSIQHLLSNHNRVRRL